MNNDPREVEEKYKELRVKAFKQMIRDVQNNETQKFLDYPLESDEGTQFWINCM